MRRQVLAISFGILALLSGLAHSKTPDALEWVRRADERTRGKTSQSEVLVQVIRPDWKREMTLKTWTKGQEFALIRVLSPARDKGSAFLKRGREVWNWVPSVERTIKLPPSMMSQSWMGTDMTNEDFVKESSIVEDYHHTYMGRDTLLGRECLRISLKPKPGAAVVWGEIRLWIDSKDAMELKTEFFDEDGLLVNTLIATEVSDMGGRMLPNHLEMLPADKPGQKTVIIYQKRGFDEPMSDNLFTLRQLAESR